MSPSSSLLFAEISALTPDTPPRQIRAVAAKARRQGRSDLLPGFARKTPTPTPTTTPAVTVPHKVSTLADILDAKSHDTRIPVAILREVFYRGLLSDAPTPPGSTRECCAHARVNSFIRLAEGDLSARNDDADLLTLLS